MLMTGPNPSVSTAVVICPSCGETYGSPERVREILRNSGFCVNLTCLADLSPQPLEIREPVRKDTTRRSTDRRAI